MLQKVAYNLIVASIFRLGQFSQALRGIMLEMITIMSACSNLQHGLLFMKIVEMYMCKTKIKMQTLGIYQQLLCLLPLGVWWCRNERRQTYDQKVARLNLQSGTKYLGERLSPTSASNSGALEQCAQHSNPLLHMCAGMYDGRKAENEFSLLEINKINIIIIMYFQIMFLHSLLHFSHPHLDVTVRGFEPAT